MTVTAQDVMTPKVLTISPQARIEEAAAQLAHFRITGLPVVDDSGSIIGMLSDFDLIGKQGRLVRDVMTTQVVSVSPDTDLDEVGRILTSRRIRRLPVVHAGRLVGIVTRGDLIKRIAQHWVCGVCGSFESGAEPPERCSHCGAEASQFSLQSEPPMMYRDM